MGRASRGLQGPLAAFMGLAGAGIGFEPPFGEPPGPCFPVFPGLWGWVLAGTGWSGSVLFTPGAIGRRDNVGEPPGLSRGGRSGVCQGPAIGGAVDIATCHRSFSRSLRFSHSRFVSSWQGAQTELAGWVGRWQKWMTQVGLTTPAANALYWSPADRSGAEPLSEDLEGHTDVVRGGRAFSAPVAEVPGGPADGHISSITVKHGQPDGRDVAVSAPPVNRVGG